MENKITIIEGPPPTFESVNEQWAWGLNDSPYLASVSQTKLRTFNGPSLVERCYTAWRENSSIQLEYRTPEGFETESTIVAARSVEIDEGDLLILWVRLPNENVELEIGYDDDASDDDIDLDNLDNIF